MDAPGRFIERLTGRVSLYGFVVDGVLVLALEDVSEDRAGVAVRRTLLTNLNCHFLDRHFCSLSVQLFDDVSLGESLYLHMFILSMLCQGHSGKADRGAGGDREKRAIHNFLLENANEAK